METHAHLLQEYKELVYATATYQDITPKRFKQLLERADDAEAHFRVWLDAGRPPLFAADHTKDHQYEQYHEHVPVCGMPSRSHKELVKAMVWPDGCDGCDTAGNLVSVYTPTQYTRRYASELWVRCTEFVRYLENAPVFMKV